MKLPNLSSIFIFAIVQDAKSRVVLRMRQIYLVDRSRLHGLLVKTKLGNMSYCRIAASTKAFALNVDHLSRAELKLLTL